MSGWIGGLQWAHPWAWSLVIAPLVLEGWRTWRVSQTRRNALAYADAHLHPWAVRAGVGPRFVWRQAARLLMGLLLAASLAGPRLPLEQKGGAPPQTRHAVNVMVVLDTSPGMDAIGSTGVSLLEQARIAVLDLLPQLRGERLGLVVYGRGAGELLPCTDDMHILGVALQQANPDLLRASQDGGLVDALALARHALMGTPGRSRAVLLMSGADPGIRSGAQLQPELMQQARALRKDGIPVFALLLQRRAWFGRTQPVLDADLIDKLAQATGGATSSLGADAWQRLYNEGLARLPSNPAKRVNLVGWQELYGLPLLCAMVLMLLLSWSDLRRRPHAKVFALLLPIVLSCFLTALPRDAHAQSLNEDAWSAWQAWHTGRYALALRLYAALPGFNARMGEGGCAYRLGAYGQALTAYRRAMLDADADIPRAQALFNLGNAAFHIPDHLAEAIDAYKASLVLAPGNSSTQRNLRLAEAQWSQEHPERAMTGIRKRAPASHQPNFGVDNGLPPSQMDRKGVLASGAAIEEQSLQAGGSLQRGTLAKNARPGAPPPVEVDLQPALRKMQLLHDHTAQLLGGLMEQDNKLAVQVLRLTP